VIEQVLYKDHLIRIEADLEPMDPREWDNFGTMVCFHGRYALGDKHELLITQSPNFSSWSEVRDHIEAELGAMVILPLFLYDHSGISIKVGSWTGVAPHAQFDSGQVGFIYCTDGDMVREGIKTLDQAEALLRNEVLIYDKYLRGDMYTYFIEKEVICTHCNHASAEFSDSCSGWDSVESAIMEAKKVVDYQVSEVSA